MPQSPLASNIQKAFLGTAAFNVTPQREWVLTLREMSSLLKILTTLKNDFMFEVLVDITAVHYPERDTPFEMVYLLLSLQHNRRIRVVLHTDGTLKLASARQVFSAAYWYEREVYDMFGVRFTNHDTAARILTEQGFEGHPLLKSFTTYGETELFFNEATGQVEHRPAKLPQKNRLYELENPWYMPHYKEAE